MQALDALREALQSRHGGAVRGILFYGSCLRSGDLFEGLVDLHVIVSDYQSAHRSAVSALGNRLLAPNVYFLQLAVGDRAVRCKYAVFSADALRRGTSRRCFESYLWGRLAQPVAIAWAASPEDIASLRAALHEATATLLERGLPLAAADGTLAELWSTTLSASYATELRSEAPGRAASIVAQSMPALAAATREVAAGLCWPLRIEAGERYRAEIPASARRLARLGWRLRRVQGTLLSVARLLKALFTFEGGLDYIAWKLERHSGRPVHVPERVRRWPLVFVWPFMWRLHREGFFR
jgi:hypothetical protein